MYPTGRRGFDDSLLTGRDKFFTYRLSDPITFSAKIPSENQQEFRGSRDFPKGEYFVSWDGNCLAVLWEQDSNKRVSRAAGRIVVDLIRDAVKSAGLDIFVQACSPGCSNLFTHVDALIVETGSRHGSSDRLMCVHRDSLAPAAEELERWFDEISYAFSLFGRFKNHARRIRDIEGTAGVRLSSLLGLQQRRSVLNAQPKLRSRVRGRYQMRGWRRSAEQLTADVWLASAGIETMRRAWDEDRRRFRGRIEGAEIADLFATDSSDDEFAVDTIELSLARQALTQTSSRLDTRMMVVVTALAGCAGLVGAVAGAVLGAAVAG